MSTHVDRDAIRRRARDRAIRMGLAVSPEPATGPAPEPLPTTRRGTLRQLLNRGHLSPGQAVAARALLASPDPDTVDTPEA